MAAAESAEIERGNRRYVATTMGAEVLDRDVEFELARRWRDEQDEAALHRLIEAYARFVVRIAWGFRGYGLPIGDLIQEGNIGLMEAASRFDPERNARFSTYGSWWIMAAIQDYILRHNSMVRVATTPAQRRLFFNLRRVRARLATSPDGGLTSEDRERVAEALNVRSVDVERMEAHLGGPDTSLNAAVGSDDGSEQIDLLAEDLPSPEERAVATVDGETRSEWLRGALDALTPRERQIIVRRFLEDEKSTLAEIGETFGVSKERIRQIEAKALTKLRAELARRVSNPSEMFVT
ncbi:MAG: RNA polymerase factor sigma-32 [Alphaproteobacteria bacterium]